MVNRFMTQKYFYFFYLYSLQEKSINKLEKKTIMRPQRFKEDTDVSQILKILKSFKPDVQVYTGLNLS